MRLVFQIVGRAISSAIGGEWAELAVVVEGDAEVLVDVEHALLMAGGLY